MLANPACYRTKRSQNYGPFLLLSVVLLLTLTVGLICVCLMLQTVAGFYANRIYPNVTVLGIDLGQLTPEEATAVLNNAAQRAETGLLTLRVGSTELTTGGSISERTMLVVSRYPISAHRIVFVIVLPFHLM